MSNVTSPFGEKVTERRWANDLTLQQFLAQWAIPASTVTPYDGIAVGRNAAGTMFNLDDTVKGEFVGFNIDVIGSSQTLSSTNTLGDYKGNIRRPQAFQCLIASAAAGDEGKKVFWLYNNQVAYNGLTNWNFAGTVLGVVDSTHVLVLPPWLHGVTQGDVAGTPPITGTTAVVLNKFDTNKLQLVNITGSINITLPAATSLSPADAISFINIGSGGFTPTILPTGSDKINGGTSYAGSTTQYAQWTLKTDGVANWYVTTPNASGTLGATTFTGAVAISGALTVTDAAANAIAVGPSGTTNPSFTVDSSAGSAITGINVIAAASGSGIAIATLGGTNEDLIIQPKGTGGFKVTSTNATAGLAVYGTGITNPAFTVVAATSGTGIKITSAAAAGGVAMQVVTSGTNEAMTIDAAAAAKITLAGAASTATGVTVGSSTSAANNIFTVYSSNATAVLVGPNGATNPTLTVVSGSTFKTGVSVTGAAGGSGVAVAATSNATNEALTIDAKGSGIVTVASVSTGGANIRIPVNTAAATGSNNISNAAALKEGFTYVTGGNNVSSVQLPVAVAGMQVTVVNAVYTATVNVYPQVNSAINNLSANTVYVMPAGSKRTFYAGTSTLWYSDNATIN